MRKKLYALGLFLAIVPFVALAQTADDVGAEYLSETDFVDPFEVEPLRERFLARNGRCFGEIFLSADSTEDGDISAALDLEEWLRRVAGLKEEIPITIEKEDVYSLADVPTGIYIGNTKISEKLGIYAPVGEGETYVIETRGNAVFIVGSTPMATRIAVGEFLREILGVEFVWPGVDGAEWTPRSEIPFPRLAIHHVPAFAWRLVQTRDETWNIHLGFGSLPHFSHNLGRIFSEDIYEKEPGLAPEVLGRKISKFTGNYAPQPNLVHPSAVSVAAAAAAKYFEENPRAPMFALGINDTTNWDESAASEEAYGQLSYYRNLPNRSDYYYSFVNRVAKVIDEKFEEKKLGAIAYMDVQQSPTFPMRENVVPVLCADRSMWVFEDFKKEDKALMLRWANSGVEYWGVYDYYYGSPFLIPRLFLEEEAEAIKYVHEHGGQIFYAECTPVVPFDAPKVWLASQLLRNPEGDPQKILDAYYEKTFGPAAEEMKMFYDFASEMWRNQGGQYRWIKGWNNENSVEIFPESALDSLRRLWLNAADAILKGDSVNLSEARRTRILARLEAVNGALSRLEDFAHSYFARKVLSNTQADDPVDAIEALKSPAWRYEEIFDDSKFSEQKWNANISFYPVSDPRPGALIRILECMKKTENAQERELFNRGLERLFRTAQKNRSMESAAEGKILVAPADKRLRILAESVPAFDAKPDTEEGFEAESFVNSTPGDWRAGKNLSYPKGWSCVLAAAEKFEMGPSKDNPHSGNTAFRIGGCAERMEIAKNYRVTPGMKVLAKVFARGTVSCGSVSYLCIEFLGKNQRKLSRTLESLPVGATPDWRRLVALGEAPEGAVQARVSLYVGLQGEDDVSFFDDLTVSVF